MLNVDPQKLDALAKSHLARDADSEVWIVFMRKIPLLSGHESYSNPIHQPTLAHAHEIAPYMSNMTPQVRTKIPSQTLVILLHM